MLWRFELCDGAGRGLALMPRARQRKVSVRLNAPQSVEGAVNGDDEATATIHSDGFPFLDPIDRALKCYRRERQTDGTFAWTIRHAGLVYDVTDSGDENTTSSYFISYSPLQRLATRKCRDAAGSDVLVIDSGDTGTMIKTQVDRTNSVKGETGIDTAGTWAPCASQSVRWERKFIAEAANELTGAYNACDLVETFVDRTTGKFSLLGATPRRGAVRAQLKLGYGAPPHNVKSFTAENHGTSLANDIEGLAQTLAAADAIVSNQSDAGSVTRYGTFEDILTATDTADQATLDQITILQLAQRRGIVPVLSLTLQEGAAPPPWIDDDGNPSWDIGDVIPAVAFGPRVRNAAVYSALAFRIHGFDLDISEEGLETVSTLLLAPATL